MSPVSSSVSRQIAVDVAAAGDGAVRMSVDLRYATSDPFAVVAVFRAGQESEVTWVFARELLTLGVSRAAGEGDVRIWPSWSAGREVLRIALISPDGEALLQTPAADIVDFLSSTYSLCPWGKESEHLDLDSALVALLAS
ncbi:MAG: SsgA family sporulation/cell division regulator [Actinomycetes bacterium]